ncbi:MAG TPA: 23S rRNA (uracil(1939)-C(5))-methyltransferase RlmD [Acidobacteriaceae bacterium]|nr:23S rRNA (uracil(1939)-C(5))-methyltransferase RlmD [Acidobacteriaceae bacterium]
MKLTIEKVIYGGQGLARVPADDAVRGGLSVFVPFTLPGEVVEAEITQEHRGYSVANAQQIVESSEYRVMPPCPRFTTCGGCQLQHSAYLHQVELKREMLRETLARAGARGLPEIATLTGKPLRYRNRVRLQVQTRPEFSIGYRQAKSHRMTAIESCPIAAPLLERCIEIIRSLGMGDLVPVDAQEIEIFTNHDQSQLFVTIWARSHAGKREKAYQVFFENLQREIPQLLGAQMLAKENRKIRSPRPPLQWGGQSVNYRVAGREYTVSAGSFFQVNCTLVDEFVAAVTDDETGGVVWDLYAGVGLFSVALAERFQRVVAVESSAVACKDLRHNLRGTRAEYVQASTMNFLRQAVERRQPAPDLVLLDPPRVGAGVEATKMLAELGPHRIVYVSCDPATLGRDLAALIQSGYRLLRLQLVDMFPQTYHMETIATLQR